VCMCRCLCRCTLLESIVLITSCPSLHSMVLQEIKLHKGKVQEFLGFLHTKFCYESKCKEMKG
jgi:hypothetical protein